MFVAASGARAFGRSRLAGIIVAIFIFVVGHILNGTINKADVPAPSPGHEKNLSSLYSDRLRLNADQDHVAKLPYVRSG